MIAQLVKNLLQHRRPWFDSCVGKICWKKDRLPTPVFLGFPGGLAGKESACNAGDLGSIPGLRRSPGEWNSYPPQYSGLEDSMDCIVHGVAELDMTEQLSFSLYKYQIRATFWRHFPLAFLVQFINYSLTLNQANRLANKFLLTTLYTGNYLKP